MMSKSTLQTIVLLALVIHLIRDTSGIDEPKFRCNEAERTALLDLKDNLYFQDSSLDIQDIGTVLSSWRREGEGRECCEWLGIRCDNETSRVIAVDLSPSSLNIDGSTLIGGNISSSLADLQYLNYLDLSNIEFSDNFPSFIGSLSKLRYLNLSSTFLSGEVTPQLGNLSSLQVVDLSNNFELTIRSLKWALRLSSLQILDLSFTNMESAEDWLQVASNLPSLTSLLLSDCVLPNVVFPNSISLVNSSNSLAVLDLSGNSQLFNSTFLWLFNYSHSLAHLDISECWFELASLPEAFGNMASLSYLNLINNLIRGSIPESFGNMTSITYLNLGQNRLEGFIPKSFGNLASLEHLDLRDNSLEGEIPKSIWEICTLRYFDAYRNKLSGLLELSSSPSSRCDNFSLEFIDLTQNRVSGPLTNFTLYSSLKELHLSSNQFSDVSESIGQLTKLEILDVFQNSIKAVMSDAHFSKLQGLKYLDLSSNSDIVLNFPSGWNPPFDLEFIHLGSCKIGPHFPSWIRSQSNYSELNISRAGISDIIPSWFWNLPSALRSLDLSNNEIMGTIPDQNHSFTYMIVQIDLSSNQLQGSVPSFLLQVDALNLFKNKFSSLNSLCNSSMNTRLSFLDVSYNRLTGELPDCWSSAKQLDTLILGNNKFTGKIPLSIGLLPGIETLHLANNNFTGELPLSSENCTELMVFDVGGNELTGEIPTWIGNSSKKLVILSLRSNNFYGSLPSKLCQLEDLQILDLSSNNLSGSIPTCLGNITAMRRAESEFSTIRHQYNLRAFPGFMISYNDRLMSQWKGSLSEIQNLALLKILDLSSNNLTREIPRQIADLAGLVSLNLSRNNLRGQIPEEIGKMKSLEVLDLSRNHLSGRLPSSMTKLNFINNLDVSNNNLSGKIPTSTQLQSFDPAEYTGNPELCGDPLPNKCPGEEPTTSIGSTDSDESNAEEQDSFITQGFYLSLGLGFLIGFWGICGSLLFIKSWRYLYYKFLNSIGEWLLVMFALSKVKLLRIVKL